MRVEQGQRQIAGGSGHLGAEREDGEILDVGLVKDQRLAVERVRVGAVRVTVAGRALSAKSGWRAWSEGEARTRPAP